MRGQEPEPRVGGNLLIPGDETERGAAAGDVAQSRRAEVSPARRTSLVLGSCGYRSYSALIWPQDVTSTAVVPANQS